MIYPFECKKCGHTEEISMPIKECVNEGHMCPACGNEMTRTIESLVCRGYKNCSGFFGKAGQYGQ